MSPVALPTPASAEHEQLNGDDSLKKVNGSNGTSYEDKVLEDYNGNYKFAPIEEAEVSRAMIKRYVFKPISLTNTKSPLIK